jgi:hypothetical protein
MFLIFEYQILELLVGDSDFKIDHRDLLHLRPEVYRISGGAATRVRFHAWCASDLPQSKGENLSYSFKIE